MDREKKKKLFDQIEKQAIELIQNEHDMDKVFQGIVKLLDENIPYYNWTGFYMMEEGELVLGHYIGKPTEHTKIQVGQGICGQAAQQKKTFIVEDVSKETNYLACSFETSSEIVVPIMKDSKILGEIDIDSDELAAFDELDQQLLERIAACLAERLE